MKNKKILIALLIITLLFTLAFNAVLATEEVSTNVVENATATGLVSTAEVTTETKKDIGDIYSMEQSVIVEKDVVGNAFLMGKDVTINNSKITGDVFVMGMNVTIDDTEITGSVFVLGQYINFTGESSATQIYACGQNINLGQNALISNDLRVVGDTIKLASTVGHNAYIDGNKLEFAGKVLGNLEYSATEEATISDEQVGGNVVFELVEESTIQEMSLGDKIKEIFKDFAGIFISLILIGMVFIFLDKKFLRTVYASSNGGAIGKSLLFALLGFAVIPLVALILIIIGIGAKTGLALVYASFLALIISVPAFVALITGMICRNKYSEENKANRKAVYGRFVLLSLAYAILSVVPFIGTILQIAAVFIGFGAIIRNVFFKEEDLIANKE